MAPAAIEDLRVLLGPGAERQLEQCEDIVLAAVHRLNGSISAEHGIGIKRRERFLAHAPPVHLDLLRRIKIALDPDGLMSPGRIL